MIILILQAFYVLTICFLTAYLVRHYIFTFAVLKQAKNTHPSISSLKIRYWPTVSILIPARNEGMVLDKLLQCMTQLTYPKDKLEIIVIDDASTDQTGQIADKYSRLSSFFCVLHRSPYVGGKGKAAAMNAGFSCAKGEIILCFDADYLPCSDIVESLVKEFADPTVGAVQGRPVVQNEPQNVLTRMAALERISGYRVDQEARNLLGLMPQFGGTVGGFRRSILSELGGFDERMLTEDTDLTFSIRLKGYRIRYVGDAECYEEAVNTLGSYWHQRHRWARGHMQVCFKHALNVVKSKKLSFKEKLDGLLLLHVYFMPVLTLFASIVGFLLFFFDPSKFVNILWFFVPLSLYSFVGNFAPFFEVCVGAYLDGRKRLQWLSPLMIFTFLFNVLICTKAFFDVMAEKAFRRNDFNWVKTEHLGCGNQYFSGQTFLRRSPNVT